MNIDLVMAVRNLEIQSRALRDIGKYRSDELTARFHADCETDEELDAKIANDQIIKIVKTALEVR